MSDIVNLRQFKKQKARQSKEQQAEQNRILHGRTKAEKEFAREETRKSENFLTLNRLEPSKKPDDGAGVSLPGFASIPSAFVDMPPATRWRTLSMKS